MTDIQDIKLMAAAITMAAQSNDLSVQNGAVVFKPANDTYAGGIIGVGVNRFPYRVKETQDRWERPQKYMWIEHAERNAIFDASREGHSPIGAYMYCPWAACADCARAIIQTGIQRLYRLPMGEHDGWSESIQVADTMLSEAGVEIYTIPLEDVFIPEGLRLGQFR